MRRRTVAGAVRVARAAATTDGRCKACEVIWRWENSGRSPRVTYGEARCPQCKGVLARACAGGMTAPTIKVVPAEQVGARGA